MIYIDDIDIYARYGVFITNGGYNELVCYAPLKNVQSINWQEQDGEEFDLSEPMLDSREFSLKFAIHGRNYNLGAFIDMLSSKVYHNFDFRTLGRTYRLRLVSMSNLDQVSKLGFVTLRFADDFPMQGYTYKEPFGGLFASQGYELDGIDLTRYGVLILDGSLVEIEKLPSVKKNLLRNIATRQGVIYDDSKVIYSTKEVKLYCLMRASDLDQFWCNYDALLWDLTRAGERDLYVNALGNSYKCYYKNCSVSIFYPVDKIWFEFSITLVFI